MPIVRVAALLLGLVSATLAHATAQRTFVASTGNDANTASNCSITKPCRGFAAAIGVTNTKGEVIVLDSAGYGAIPSITQSVSIIAPTGIYAGISVFSGDGVTINAGVTDTVVLRGLNINGQGGVNGLTINNALAVHVENCVIANMTGIGINQAKGLLEVKDSIVRNNGNIGVYVVAPAVANLDHVRLEANNTGLAAELGGWVAMQDSVVTGSSNIGVVVTISPGASSKVTITRSLISSNSYGIYVEGLPADSNTASAAISESTISNNSVGVHASGNNNNNGKVHLKHNMITANVTGLEVLNTGHAHLDGNYIWTDAGVDLTVDASSLVATVTNNMVRQPIVSGILDSIIPF